MTAYGFIVLAFLLIPDHAPIPFATVDACEAARTKYVGSASYSSRYRRQIMCFYTGAPR